MHRIALSTIEEVINGSTIVPLSTHIPNERELVVTNEEGDLMVIAQTISVETIEGTIAHFYKVRGMTQKGRTFKIDLVQSPAILINTMLEYINESTVTDSRLGTYTKAKVAAS